MTASLLRDLAYLLDVLLDLGAAFFALQWMVHALPGAGLNRARRAMFRISFPILGRAASFGPHLLVLAVLLAAAERFLVPWLVFLGYSLRG